MYASCPACGSRLITHLRNGDRRYVSYCANHECNTANQVVGSGETPAIAESAFIMVSIDFGQHAAWDAARVPQ